MKSLILSTMILGLSTTAFANPEPSVLNEINYHSSGSTGEVTALTVSNPEPSIISQFGDDYHQVQQARSGSAPQVGDSQNLDRNEWFTYTD